ncbi:TetR-like C-terminal domain-containing protein [Cohnella sp. REN36]|uniref:TetR-like C-terminal domain-containing protein n=1 Tax=Cohnella sp. REN36 TaxID=2887347 RepID=UPI001D13FE0F|nr:TetR family transcriptional regulator C-terminal domain-containing protein [Cohnella sp. REN36]
MDPTHQRTDPRILRTRRLLREAFVELLQEMEIDKITVNRLAERATINRVTFYLHYKDIPDMMDKMADEMVEDLSAILEQTVAGEDPTNGEEWPMMVHLLEHIAEQSKFYKVILSSRRAPVFTERLLKLLSKMIQERFERSEGNVGITRAGIQRDVAIWYGSSALIGTIVSWLRNDMPYTPAYLAKQFSLLRGRFYDKR